MNKIYKIIWSKARNCYVVVSELAKRNGKASSGLNKKIIAAFLAAGTVMAVNGSAWADYSNVDITQANDKTITKTYYGNAGSNAIAIGAGTGTNAAKALAEDSIAIGAGAAANYEQNVVIGANSKTKGQLSTAIGADSKAYGYRSVAIGYDAQALDKFASSSDPSDPSNKSRAVAIGAGSRALANRSVAIGDNAIAEQGKAWVVSIGANSYSGLLGANANGYGARAFGKNSVAMGRQARAGEPATDLSMNDATTYVTSKGNMDGFGAVAIGYMADAKKNGSFAVGYKAQAHGVNSMAFGSGQAQTDSDFVNITKALGDNSIAFGYNSRALANNAVSFGAYTEATGQRSLVFGTSGTDAVASGMGLLDNSRAAGQGSIAIGDRAVVDSKILVQSDAPDASVNDAISIGTEAHVRARNAVAIGGNISYTNDDNETVYGRSHNGRDFGALVGEGADSAIAIGGATLDESTSDFTTGTLAVKYEAAASLGKRGVAIGSGALVFSGDAFARYEAKINSTEYQNAKLAFETAESEYLNATMQVSMKETEIASLDPSSADYETEKTRLEGELAALTANANDKLAALDGARPAWQEQEAAALSLQQGNAEAVADAIAIGTNARAGIKNSIALGKDAQTGELAESSIAIGEGAVTGKDAVRAIVIGKDSTVNGADSIAVGHGHTVNGKNSGTFGDPNIVNADNTYVVGNNSTVEKNITNAFVFGNDVTVNNGTLPDGWDTLSDDDKANQTGYGVIAIGNNVTASLNENVSRESGTPKVQHVAAIGDNAVVGEENAVAIGFGAKSIAYNSVSVGTGAVSNAENAMAFGNSAYATEAGGVALGSFSKANRAPLYGTTTAGYDASKDADRTGDDADSPAWQSTLGAVSIGVTEEGAKTTATGTRQLTGLAAGTADTDAVNVAQLKAVSAGNSMNFGGDNTTATDNIITVKGGEQLNVKGGAEDLTNDNIGIVADTTKKTLNVKLSNKISLNDGGHLVIGKTTDEKGQTVVDQNGVTLYPASSASGSAITKFTKNGISAGNQKIEYVKAGEADTDAVNVGQLATAAKAAKTEVVKGTNVTSVDKTIDETGDGHTIYTVNVDDLTYQVGTNAAKNVSLKNGLHFVDGTNTTAVQNEDGSIQFNATHNRLTGVTVTPASDSSNAMTAELADADGNKTTVNLQNTYTTVTKSGNTITFRRNDGVSESISLSDLGATDYRLVPAADGKYKVNGDGSLTLQVKDARNEGAAAVDVKIEDIASKTQQDINTSNIAANRADLDAGWTATVGNNTINVNPEHNGLSFASSDDHVTVTADGRTIKVGVQNLADTGLGNITEEGKTVITNLARDAVTVQGENGIEVTRSADKSTYTVKTKLGDNLTLREGNIDLANTVKIGNGADMHTVIVDGTKGEVTGLTNTTWSKDGAYNAGRAATEEQLKDVYEAAKGDALGSVKLKFQGESGDTLERGNNEILQIVGDESNITTKAEDGKLKVELSKDLNVNSVTAGNTVINDDGVTADKVTVGGTTIEDKKITVGDTVIDGTSVKAGDTTINNDGLTIDGGPSVTKGGIDAGKKKITGVAAGVAGTDAVNVDQLKEATSGLRTEVKGGTNVTVTKDTTTAADGHTIYTVNADGAKVSEADGGAVTVTGAKDTTTNITDYKVDLSDTAKASLDKVEKDGLTFKGDTGTSNKIKLGDTLNIKGGASGALSDGNIGVEAEGDTLNIKLAKDIKGVDTIRVNKSITAGDTVITGDGVTANMFKSGATVINNEGVTATKFTAGETSVSSNGLAIEGGPSVTKGGIDAGGKQVTNVAAGENDTDAATFGQLKDLAAGAGQAINNVSNEISRVDSRMKKGLAGAAALAALHPIDTDDKFTMGLGYGNYRNAHAGAIGVFYRPTEKIMLSVGGAMGNGENMINAGLSFALDKGKGFGTSKAVMARKINDLTAENAAQAAKIETLEARLAAIESKLEK